MLNTFLRFASGSEPEPSLSTTIDDGISYHNPADLQRHLQAYRATYAISQQQHSQMYHRVAEAAEQIVCSQHILAISRTALLRSQE